MRKTYTASLELAVAKKYKCPVDVYLLNRIEKGWSVRTIAEDLNINHMIVYRNLKKIADVSNSRWAVKV